MSVTDRQPEPPFASSPTGTASPTGVVCAPTLQPAGPATTGRAGHPGGATIKALSVMQPFASLLVTGIKTIETRTWPTSYRGWLLICAGIRVCGTIHDLKAWNADLADRLADALWGRPARAGDELPTAVAVGVVKVVTCRRMAQGDNDLARADWLAACCDPYPNAWGFVCERAYRIQPFPVRGHQGLWNQPVTQDQLVRI